jgi:hypothetical protein
LILVPTKYENDEPVETQQEDVKLVSDETVDRFEALPRPTALFLHGVDDMSTKEISSYCHHADLVKVEWINDSSCNLAFTTQEQAQEALKELVVDKDQDVNHLQLTPAKPFVNEDGESFSLFIRISTDEDIKERGARERSRYYKIHGTENENISKERKESRKEHYERMNKSGGDGRSVFSRLGSKRNRSLSPSQKETRELKRERTPEEREIPDRLKSRLGPLTKPVIKQEEE